MNKFSHIILLLAVSTLCVPAFAVSDKKRHRDGAKKHHENKDKKKKNCPCNNGVTFLRQEDFASGTYRIKESGTYVLCEDIVFQPDPTLEDARPDLPQGVMGLGVRSFAALTIEVDDVTVDLNGFTISQGVQMNKDRALKGFSDILIGNSFVAIFPLGVPDLQVEGIPNPGFLNFADVTEVVRPSNVTIKNGGLGLTGHFCIHSPAGCRNVTLKDLVLQDFEIAGIQGNNVEGTFHMENVQISGNNHVIWNRPPTTQLTIMKLQLEGYLNFQPLPGSDVFTMTPTEIEAAEFHLANINRLLQAPTLLGPDPLTTTAASTVITVNQPNHGLMTGDLVTIFGVNPMPTSPMGLINPNAGSLNGIPVQAIEGEQTITVLDPNNYTITVEVPPADIPNIIAGSNGGSNVQVVLGKDVRFLAEEPLQTPVTNISGLNIKEAGARTDAATQRLQGGPNSKIILKNVSVANIENDEEIVPVLAYGKEQLPFVETPSGLALKVPAFGPQVAGAPVPSTTLQGIFGFIPWNNMFTTDLSTFEPDDYFKAFIFTLYLNLRTASGWANTVLLPPPPPFTEWIAATLPDGFVEEILGPNLKGENPVFNPDTIAPAIFARIDSARGAFGMNLRDIRCGRADNVSITRVKNTGPFNIDASEIGFADQYPNSFGIPEQNSQPQQSAASFAWGIAVGEIAKPPSAAGAEPLLGADGFIFNDCLVTNVESEHGSAFGYDGSSQSVCLEFNNCEASAIFSKAGVNTGAFIDDATGVAYGFRSQNSTSSRWNDCRACDIVAERQARGFEAEDNASFCEAHKCQASNIKVMSEVDNESLPKEAFGFSAVDGADCCTFEDCSVNGVRIERDLETPTNSLAIAYLISQADHASIERSSAKCVDGGAGLGAGVFIDESNDNVVTGNTVVDTVASAGGVTYGYFDSQEDASTTLFKGNEAVNNDTGAGDSANYKVTYAGGTPVPTVTATYTDFSNLTPESTLANNTDITATV